MKMFNKIPSIAAATLLGLAAWAPHAHAGHLNPVLEAELDGREEVPAEGQKKAGDPNGRGKAYVFGIDGDPLTLCYILVELKKVDELELAPGNGRAAHIHEGARGSNGGVVANLAWPQDGQAGDCLTEGEMGKFPTGEVGIVQRILNNPSMFYVNVHNAVHPTGAIRGQLMESGGEHKHKDKKHR
ncbi:CHRD domain-containing protein [Piscinibacter sakaiensis]|uniref:CHRD domain-containing protein n=1 Tax=Piscinibacter sakaiensis TaxID=1547922 RepID=UPI003AAC1A41